MDRRRYLRHAAAAAVAAVSAGCSSDNDSPRESEADLTTPADPRVRTHRWAPPDDSLSCADEAVEPMEAVTDEQFPEQSDALELTASTDTVVIGDEITFSLRNVGTEVTSPAPFTRTRSSAATGTAGRLSTTPSGRSGIARGLDSGPVAATTGHSPSTETAWNGGTAPTRATSSARRSNLGRIDSSTGVEQARPRDGVHRRSTLNRPTGAHRSP